MWRTSGLPGNLATVIAFDHAEREIDPGRETTGRREISVLDKARAALKLNVRKLMGEPSKCAVVGGRGFTVKQTSFRQNKCACTNRHGDIGGF
jgi:hypothetical protein